MLALVINSYGIRTIKYLPSSKRWTRRYYPSQSTISSNLRSFSLCGFGGMGKTQIAMFYAFKREQSFDTIPRVQADEPTKIIKSFDDIAKALDLVDGSDQGDKVVSRDKVLRWLSDPRKRLIANGDGPELARLMIFDNADNIDLAKEYWPLSF